MVGIWLCLAHFVVSLVEKLLVVVSHCCFSCFFCAAVLGHLCRGRSHEWSHNLTECYCWLSLVWKSECAASLLSRAWMNRGHRGPTDVIYQLFTDVKSPIQRRSVVASASATGKTWRRQQRQQHQSTTNCVRLHHGCSVERRRRRPASIDRRRRQRWRLWTTTTKWHFSTLAVGRPTPEILTVEKPWCDSSIITAWRRTTGRPAARADRCRCWTTASVASRWLVSNWTWRTGHAATRRRRQGLRWTNEIADRDSSTVPPQIWHSPSFACFTPWWPDLKVHGLKGTVHTECAVLNGCV